jgi:hypothetical protein
MQRAKSAYLADTSITESYALLGALQANYDSGSAYRGSNPWGAAKTFQQLANLLGFARQKLCSFLCVAGKLDSAGVEAWSARPSY